MSRIALILMLALTPANLSPAAQVSPRASTSLPAPALPYFDWGACPFEGCAYREWTARKSIIVYDTWKQQRRKLEQLSTGDRVLAVTGVVITFKPGVVLMDRDLPDRNLARGDRILTYAYRGEGFSAVWRKGTYYAEFDISFAKWPDGVDRHDRRRVRRHRPASTGAVRPAASQP